ncbi:MAG: pyrroline-5-carboxylate reductase [Novosphingobium sp.]
MKILIVGCGNMGGAMLAGWLAGGHAAADFAVIDPFLAAVPEGVALLRDLPAAAAAFDVILLGVKPQQLGDAAGGLVPLTGANTVLLSILAGVDLATLRRRFPQAGAIVRVMPNLAAALGKSPVALSGDCSAAQRILIERLMAPLGRAEWLGDEGLMDLMTALVGSGPAFVYRVIDAFAAGAEGLGLARDQADRLARAMVEGAAALAAQAHVSPGELAKRVASPGGTTQKGLEVMDANGALERLIEATLRAARDRGSEMAAEARAAG